jgi:hypothetical protein
MDLTNKMEALLILPLNQLVSKLIRKYNRATFDWEYHLGLKYKLYDQNGKLVPDYSFKRVHQSTMELRV